MSDKETYVESRGGKLGRWGVNISGTLVMIYLFIPISIILIFSFNDPSSKFNLVWKGFTTKHWVKTIMGGEPNKFYYPELNNSLDRSIYIALGSSLIAVILGSLIAFALARRKIKGSGAIAGFLVLPLTTPEIVLGASLLTLFLDFTYKIGGHTLKIPFGMPTIFIAHIMFCMSYITLTVKARLRGFDWAIEDAAKDLGANGRQTFFKVIFPLALPGIFAAFLLSFALSFDDFIITLFVSGDVKTFPIQVFGQSRTAIPPQINVLSSILLIITTTIFIIPTVLSIRKQKKIAKIRANTP